MRDVTATVRHTIRVLITTVNGVRDNVGAHRALVLSALLVGLLGGQTRDASRPGPGGGTTIIRTVLLHGIPEVIAVDTIVGRAFIAVSGATLATTGGVSAIIALNTRTGVILRTIPLREPAHALAVDTQAGVIFAATAHSVTALDAQTGAMLHTTAIPALVNPTLAVDEQASRVIVAGSSADTSPYAPLRGTTLILDTRSGARLHKVTLRGGPTSVAVDARTARAFVSVAPLKGNGYIAVLDSVSGRLVQTRSVTGTPKRIAVDTRTARVFVVDGEAAEVSVLDARSGILVGTAPVGAEPWALAVDERIGRVFVVNQARRSTVSELDAASGRLLRTVEVGENAVAVAMDATTGRVFVVNGGALHTSANMNLGASVSELDAVSGRLLRTIPLSTAFFPRSVAVDERAGRALVVSVPSASGTAGAVTILDTMR